MKDQVTSVVTPVVAQFDLELETVEVIPAGKRRLLRVVVDGEGPDGRGPLLDDIAEATKAISAALDSAVGLGNAPYTLEVTSRGVSRPLEAPRHWRRNTDRLVAVTLTAGGELVGRIRRAGDDEVALVVDGDERTLGYSEIARALVQVELNRSSAASAGATEEFDEAIDEADRAEEED